MKTPGKEKPDDEIIEHLYYAMGSDRNETRADTWRCTGLEAVGGRTLFNAGAIGEARF